MSRFHLLSGSDDSNVHVWTLPRLLEMGSAVEDEPDRTLSNHRAAVTSLVVGQSSNPDTNLCVSASKDKTCLVWNYRSGTLLRTLLFPASPLCLALDPGARALSASCEEGSIYVVELFGEKPLLGPHSAEEPSTVVQVSAPFGSAPADAGPASCLALTYDGTALLSGHPRGRVLQWNLSDNSLPVELANLGAAVTNLAFVPPLSAAEPALKVQTVVKPSQADRTYTITAQFEADLGPETEFRSLLNTAGFPRNALEEAILSLQQPAAGAAGDQELQKQNEQLLEIVNEQRALYQETLRHYAGAKPGSS